MTVIGRRWLGRTGLEIPALCLGCGSLATGGDARQVEAMLESGWSAGLRYFDTAPLYGNSERVLGSFLQHKKRDHYLLATKVGRYPAPAGTRRFSFRSDDVARSIEQSLDRLRTHRFDIVMLHDFSRDMLGEDFAPAWRDVLDDTFPLLSDMKAQGVIGAVGIATYDSAAALDLIRAAPLDMVMIVGAYTLLSQEADIALLPYCLEHGVGVLAASPFHTGLLITGAVPGALFNFQPASTAQLNHVALIEEVCRRHDIPLAAAALQYGRRHPAIAAIVAGHATPQQVESNLALMTMQIPEAFWDELADARLVPPSSSGLPLAP